MAPPPPIPYREPPQPPRSRQPRRPPGLTIQPVAQPRRTRRTRRHPAALEPGIQSVSQPIASPSHPRSRPQSRSNVQLVPNAAQQSTSLGIAPLPPPVIPNPLIATNQNDENREGDNKTDHRVRDIPQFTMFRIHQMIHVLLNDLLRDPQVRPMDMGMIADSAVARLATIFSASGALGLPDRRRIQLPNNVHLDKHWILPNAVQMGYLSPELKVLARTYLTSEKQRQRNLPLSDIIEGLNAAIAEGKLFGVEDRTILVNLSDMFVVKIGQYDMLDDIEMLRYIAANAPQVPLPKIHGSLRAVDMNMEWGFLFMSNYCTGYTLGDLWSRLDHEQKISIRDQLEGIFRALRSVEPPRPFSRRQATLGGGSPRRCKDSRGYTYLALQPLYNEVDFNKFVTSHFPQGNAWSTQLKDHLREDHNVVMTYGNLHPRNIIISPVPQAGMPIGGNNPNLYQVVTGNATRAEVEIAAHREWRVTCLVNWQRGGVYPEHWEYVKALNPSDTAGCLPRWWYYLPRSIGTWPIEHAADCLIMVP
ncbi:hypothetical protein GX48_00567 [Paracoccidioides brasiliensis]|nr:hypothetical protein GX48_00567 [Paracoccidioides brasiliensis]